MDYSVQNHIDSNAHARTRKVLLAIIIVAAIVAIALLLKKGGSILPGPKPGTAEWKAQILEEIHNQSSAPVSDELRNSVVGSVSSQSVKLNSGKGSLSAEQKAAILKEISQGSSQPQ